LNIEELVVGKVAIVGEGVDIVNVVLDVLLVLGDIFIEAIALDVEHAFEEGDGVGDVDVGLVNLTLNSAGILVMFVRSSLVCGIS